MRRGNYPSPLFISIHSPRMGRDRQGDQDRHCSAISIHSPRMGRDFAEYRRVARPEHFNPLSPHGERPFLPSSYGTAIQSISIHSPRMGRDVAAIPCRSWNLRFQSTLPAWGETRQIPSMTFPQQISIHSPRMGRDAAAACATAAHKISIHSPRMGRDTWAARSAATTKNFNPLSPHGERRYRQATKGDRSPFQSTLPAWGETLLLTPVWALAEISIHSPRMGRDEAADGRSAAPQFQSTLPAWGETDYFNSHMDKSDDFNPLSPHGERQLCGLADSSRD